MKRFFKYLITVVALVTVFVGAYYIYVPAFEDYKRMTLQVKYAWLFTVAVAALAFFLRERQSATILRNAVSANEARVSFAGIKGSLRIPPIYRNLGASIICAVFVLDGLGSFIYFLRLLDPIFYICAFVDYYLPFVNELFLAFYNLLPIFPDAEQFAILYGYLVVQQLLLFGVSLSFFKILKFRLKIWCKIQKRPWKF